MITKAARRIFFPVITLLVFCSAPALKAEQHPLDTVPRHFITTGYFSTQPEGYYSPAIRMARDELLVPLVSVTATSFAAGFVHRFLADRLKSNGVSTLGWPLLNLTYYFFMRPEFDRYTALRLLPSIGDTAMTLARGERWAGAATPWLRTANTIYAAMESIWPELEATISAYRQCKLQPVVVEGGQSAASLSILTCPFTTSAPNNKPALVIDFLDTDKVSTPSLLMEGLYQLRDVCSSKSISKLALVYEHSPDGRMQLRVVPLTGSGWQTPKVLGINNLQGGDWWSDLNFAAIQDSRLVLPPLSPSIMKGIESIMNDPHYNHCVDVDSAQLEPVAGLLALSQESGDAFWFRPIPGSLLPGGYPPLPEAVLSLNNTWQGVASQADKFRKHSLVPETAQLPWKIARLGFMSFIRNQSIMAAEKLARFVEEPIVLPGTLLGKGIIPDHVLPPSVQTYELKHVPGLGTPEKVAIQTNDGQYLQGLLIRSNNMYDTSERTLHIHYHGNGETSHHAGRTLFQVLEPNNQPLAEFCNQQGVDILIPEYRGYRNDLEPVDGKTLLDDANLFYQLLNNQYRRVTVSGWSLGSGMAAWVSGQNNPNSTILISPFTSLDRVGKDALMGITIPKWLVKFNMETDHNIPHIPLNTNIYLRHGSGDQVIAPQNSQDLYNILNGSSRDNVDMRILPSRDHNDILYDSDISDLFARVLKRE